MDTQQLIEKLSVDLKPGEPMRLPLIYRNGIFVACAFIFFILATLFRVRADIASRLAHSSFILMVLTPMVISMLAWAWVLSSTLLVQRKNRSAYKLVLFLATAVYLGFTALYSLQWSPVFELDKKDLVCTALIFILSLPVWLALTMFGAAILPTRQGFPRGTAFLATALGAIIVTLHCPYEGHGHHFLGHGVWVVVTAGATYMVLSRILARGVSSLIEAREKRLFARLLK